ncbi:MAG: glycine--tRNA ligase subunit beta [Gammaproteobacteria bacterium]
MSEARDLLIEIGTEELPPKALKELSDAFSRRVFDGLAKAALVAQWTEGAFESFATPRRLAVLVRDVIAQQRDSSEVRTGPAISAAFKHDGEPTKAAVGFARSCGVAVENLEKENDRLICRIEKKGVLATELIPNIVTTALAGLPIPKRMRWGSSTVEFVRPVHWVVLLHGTEAIAAQILGISAGRETRGHRFHYPQPMPLKEPTEYESLLKTKGYVIANYADRRNEIKQQVMETAQALHGNANPDDSLLDEVTALVEWPVVISGDFDPDFLEIPPEALVSSMQVHQKCFSITDSRGKLMPHFITISNIESRDPAQVRAGNERVMRPRLADAAFFWNQDRKHALSGRLDKLKQVIFQHKLGSLWDKTQRISSLAGLIAERLGTDPAHARRAGLLSKCDLLTKMVGEFPELQGIMGRYYADKDGEPKQVCSAIDEQYMPRFGGDCLPQAMAGQALAIADKLDTLAGIFGIGQIPSGTKDPYALRRAALGVLRIMIEGDLDLDVMDLLNVSVQSYGDVIAGDTSKKVFDFMMDRLRAYYVDAGIPYDSVEAVLACQPRRPRDFDKRVRAVSEFRTFPESESLAAANKRIRNILKKTDEIIPDTVDKSMLAENAEKQLAEQLFRFSREVEPLFEAHDYTPALTKLTGLCEPVDNFFDNVMVMTKDDRLRANRLALLNQLSSLFFRVADISRLER